jgi:hypothetical protein
VRAQMELASWAPKALYNAVLALRKSEAISLEEHECNQDQK